MGRLVIQDYLKLKIDLADGYLKNNSMAIYNPPHPGEFIREIYLEPYGITGRQLAFKLGVAPSTLNRILKGRSGISSEMALRLSKGIGTLTRKLADYARRLRFMARQTIR